MIWPLIKCLLSFIGKNERKGLYVLVRQVHSYVNVNENLELSENKACS